VTKQPRLTQIDRQIERHALLKMYMAKETMIDVYDSFYARELAN